MGWFEPVAKIGAVVADYLSPGRRISRKRKKIRKMEKELEDIVKNQTSSDSNRERVAHLMRELSLMQADLEDDAS